jgi:putative acetyltransferase
MLDIRPERPEDRAAIRAVNDQAFGDTAEGRIVELIRAADIEMLSLVAMKGDDVVGHILFSPVVIEAAGENIVGLGLAPMAVVPEFQRQGIGTALVHEGLRRIRASDCPFVIVVGHEHYYPRFGFRPASGFGLRCQWDGVPDAAFMALILDAERMRGVTGVARYRPEFDEAM